MTGVQTCALPIYESYRYESFYMYKTSDDLLSQAVTHQVPSALKGLTSVFGMGTGVTPSLLSLDFEVSG